MADPMPDDDGGEEVYYTSGEQAMFPVRWTAPESMRQGGRFTTASDVWSFGILMLEVFQDGARPYPGLGNAQVMRGVMDGSLRHPAPRGCPAETFEVLSRCWQQNPADRPDFASLCTWFGRLVATGGRGGATTKRRTSGGSRSGSLQAAPVGERSTPVPATGGDSEDSDSDYDI